MRKMRQGTKELRIQILRSLSTLEHQEAFARRLFISKGTLEYHMRWLKKAGLVKGPRWPWYRPVEDWRERLEKSCD